MKPLLRDKAQQRAALDEEFDLEVARLAGVARCGNPVESVMRLRALVEISGVLDTDALVALAVQISEGDQAASFRAAPTQG